jgi:hypothetical protein
LWLSPAEKHGVINGLIFSIEQINHFYMSNRKIFAGIVTVIAAGAVIGLVLSSKKGRQTGNDLWK